MGCVQSKPNEGPLPPHLLYCRPPEGVHSHMLENVDLKKLSKLVRSGRLAPLYPHDVLKQDVVEVSGSILPHRSGGTSCCLQRSLGTPDGWISHAPVHECIYIHILGVLLLHSGLSSRYARFPCVSLQPACIQGMPSCWCCCLQECPICTVSYPSMNTASCCAARVCTECFVYHQTASDPPGKAQCPFCKNTPFAVRVSICSHTPPLVSSYR